MKRQEFIDHLKSRGYAHTLKGSQVVVTHHGYVDLRSLTSLPEGTKFENHGHVYLNSLEGEHVYQGAKRTLRNVDGYTMLINGQKEYGGYTVQSARFFAGGPITDMKRYYVAESDGLYAHGATMKEAVEDLQYKIKDSADKTETAKRVVATGRVTLAQFRAITGACREGVRQHLAQQGIQLDDISDMALSDALEAMKGTTYGDTFAREVQS